MRKLFTQKEVIKAAEMLGIKPFTRGNIWYWERQGVFPEPYSQLKGGVAWYKRDKVIVGLINVSNRLIKAGKLYKSDSRTWIDINDLLNIVAKDHPDITKQLSKLKKIK